MTNGHVRLAIIGACAAALGIGARAQGAVITPAGLNPGDSYQLVFITSGTTAATSADIATYNSFVQSAAAAAGMGAVTWHAIGSTMSVDANSNALVSTRVYNMNGELVANSYADFWDGSHANGIDYTENNAGRNSNVWTGTLSSGASGGSGDALGETTPLWGECTLLNSGAWTAHGGQTNTVAYSLYGLSEPLTVVPEPGTLLLLGAAMAGSITSLRRRRC